MTTAVCALVGFVVGGIFLNVLAAWVVTLACFAAAMVFLPKILNN
jgi:hypothetical protein